MATAIYPLERLYPYNKHISDCMNENSCFLLNEKKIWEDLNNECLESDGKAIENTLHDIPQKIKTKLQSIHVCYFSEAILPTDIGKFHIRVYTSLEYSDLYNILMIIIYKLYSSFQPVALISGKIENSCSVAVRVHDQCFTSEVIGSKKCDCKEQLEYAKKYIKENGGMIIYLQQEGRGIGLANKIAAYHLQDDGKDTVEANRALGLEDDYRTYECVKQILDDLHISSIRLMTNNPYKKISYNINYIIILFNSLEQLGIKIDSLIPIIITPNKYDIGYLHCKAERMGHMLPLDNIPNNTDNTAKYTDNNNEILI